MNKSIMDFYHLPDITAYEDMHLLDLAEECAALEEQIAQILLRISDLDRQILTRYIDARNDLEVQSFKTALRWGKRHYK